MRYFTWLVWEFVNDPNARATYLKVDHPHAPTTPPGFETFKPSQAQDKALRSDSCSAINAEIIAEWPAAVTPPLVPNPPTGAAAVALVSHPHPRWPSHP